MFFWWFLSGDDFGVLIELSFFKKNLNGNVRFLFEKKNVSLL